MTGNETKTGAQKRVGRWGDGTVNMIDEFKISKRTFFPTGSRKVTGKQFSSVDEEINVKIAEKMKKYGVNNGMRRYVKIMKDKGTPANNAPVVLDDGSIAYTDKDGNITYIDGDAVNEIYANELAEENAIDEMTRKALLSDTVARILLGESYDLLEGSKVDIAELKPVINHEKIRMCEARPEYLRCLAPKSLEYSEGITKLRAIIKMCRPVLEYKSSKADDNIYKVDDLQKIPTGMVDTR